MTLTKLPEETKRNMDRNYTSAEWTVLELQASIRNEIKLSLASQQGNPTASFATSLHHKQHAKRERERAVS